MGSKNNEPSIRFIGFNDNWEQRKLREVAEIIGGGTPNTNIPEYWDGDIDWYSPSELNGQIYADRSERKITKLGLEKSSAKTLPANKTILFTSRAGIGKTAILKHSAATNQGFQSIIANDDIDTYFIYSMSKSIKEKAEIIASGSTFAEISGKMLGKIEFMFPSKEEQVQIGFLFSNLDNLISLHQRKLDNLEILKKTFFNKLFPKNNETIPLFRFNGFSDDWYLCKFNEIFVPFPNKEYQIQSTEYNEYGKYPVIDQGKKTIIGYNDRIDKVCYKIPSIIFGDHTTELKYVDFPFIVGADGVKTLFVKKNNSIFQYYNLVRNNIKPTGYNRHFNILKKISLSSTYMNEQEKIGLLMRELDNLITLHQRKIEQLQQMKQYFLKNMFV